MPAGAVCCYGMLIARVRYQSMKVVPRDRVGKIHRAIADFDKNGDPNGEKLLRKLHVLESGDL
eukprot:1824007-Rhodomonas_salina.1